jgi:hypothetical protein
VLVVQVLLLPLHNVQLQGNQLIVSAELQLIYSLFSDNGSSD